MKSTTRNEKLLIFYLLSALLLLLLPAAFEATDFFRLTAGDSDELMTFPTLVSGTFGDMVVL